jgi:acetoacetyl-CoA synthetase
MAVEALNDDGQPVRGGPGELSCLKPFPSMPVGFWNDADGERYRKAYFDKFPNVWSHGDYVEITAHGGVIIHGRSDATLNPGGVRIGTAEIYRQVEQVPEILDCVAVGQHWQDDERVILFVRLRDDATLDDDLRTRIVRQIRSNTTPRHVPAKIIQVADIPRTISGKITEIAVREAIHGRPVRNTDALANPESLAYFRDLPELAAP